MAGQDQTDIGPAKHGERLVGTAQDAVLQQRLRREEWVVADHDAHRSVGQGCQPLLQPRQLPASDPTVRPVETPGCPAYGIDADQCHPIVDQNRSEEHTSELQSLMRISYAVFCLKKKHNNTKTSTDNI